MGGIENRWRRGEGENWLSDMDSNHDKSLQRALCYHYTIGHAETKVALTRRRCQEKIAFHQKFPRRFRPRLSTFTAEPLRRAR